MRGLDRGAHFVIGHELLARIVAGGSDAAGRHDLDQVGSAPPMFRTRRRASSGVFTIPFDQPGCERPGSRPLRGSPWPAVGPSGSSETQRHGPGILPSAMAFRTATVSSPPPTLRAPVKPC